MILLGHWHYALAYRTDGDERAVHIKLQNEALNLAIEMINNNPTLLAPMRDDHMIEIGMLMLLAQESGRLNDVDGYLREVANRIAYRYVRRSNWVTCLQDYRRLARHPFDRNDSYFQRSTIGSVLVPFVLVGLERLGAMEELAEFQSVVQNELSHMTQQLWVPHEGTDDAIWRQGESIGVDVPVPSLNLEGDDSSRSDEVEAIAQEHTALIEIAAIQIGMVALFLMACRHHRLPLPPHLWFAKALEPKMEAGIDGTAADMPS